MPWESKEGEMQKVLEKTAVFSEKIGTLYTAKLGVQGDQ